MKTLSKTLPAEIVQNIMNFFLEVDKATFEDFNELFEFYLVKFINILNGLKVCEPSFMKVKGMFERLLEIMCLPKNLTEEGMLRRATFMNFILGTFIDGDSLNSKLAYSYCLKLATEKGFYKNHPDLLEAAQKLKSGSPLP